MRSHIAGFAAAPVLAFAPFVVRAQVLRGEVRERESAIPVAGAAVFVRDSARGLAGFARTDEAGRFALRVPAPGFAVRVARVGFAPESVATAGLGALDTTDVLIEMRRLAVTLAPAVIEAERRGIRDIRVLGLDLRTFSTNIITPTEIELASRGARTYLDAIRSALPAGVVISERSQCVAMTRGAMLNARSACAQVYVDGMQLADPDAAIDMVQPQWLDHAIFVRPTDAGMRFGTGAGGGVLLLFTKFGGYALDRDLALALAGAKP
jgi:hypothetical protein